MAILRLVTGFRREWSARERGRFVTLAARVAVFGVTLTSVAFADPPGEPSAPAPVALDALFKLPSRAPTLEGPREQGGASQREWTERFAVARRTLAEAKAALAETQRELEELALGSQSWQVAAPGGASTGGEQGPLSFKLRQQIRGDREAVELAEKALMELRVEATLAGVPDAWIGEATPATSGAAEDPRSEEARVEAR